MAYNTLTIVVLKSLLKDASIGGYSRMNKDGLVKLLEKSLQDPTKAPRLEELLDNLPAKVPKTTTKTPNATVKKSPVTKAVPDEVQAVRDFIEAGFDEEIHCRLSDDNLKNEIHEKEAFQKCQEEVKVLVEENYADKDKLIEILANRFVPTGLKGIVRGLAFNREVLEWITSLIEGKCDLELHPEAYPYDLIDMGENKVELPERPDWVVINNKDGRCLVGYNQIDLWSGGAQLNRGDKYVNNETLHTQLPDYLKLVSVVCNKAEITSSKSKKYQLLETGMKTGRLVYPGHLGPLIETFFA